MKINEPVTQRNIEYPSDIYLVTTTDLKGIITYANPDFMKISGFSHDELVGKSHNIVRHPDMPVAAFADLWDHLKAGKSWSQLVKNRAKNGDHYWVSAYVSPVYHGEKIVGYQSVRTKPSVDQIKKAEHLYADMRRDAGIKVPKTRKKAHDLPIRRALAWVVGFFVLLQVFAFYLRITDQASHTFKWIMGLTDIILPMIWFALLVYILNPVDRITKTLDDMTRGILRTPVTSEGDNEIGRISKSVKNLQARLFTMFGIFQETGDQLAEVANKLSDRSSQAVHGLEKQSAQTELVAAAMNEMSSTVQDVARNAANTADSVQGAHTQADAGKAQVMNTHEAIAALADQLNNAAHSINTLKEQGTAIENVVNLISGIADQTNLLALNAAIEAARAGEHGRGFAVVADEVRALAAKTQSSTVDIRQMITTLRGEIDAAVDVVQAGHRQMEIVKTRSSATESALGLISGSITKIGDMATQIATATEEQSMVAEEMNRNIHTINQQTETAHHLSEENETLGLEIAQLSDHLENLLAGFSICKGKNFAKIKAAHLAWKTKIRIYLDGHKNSISGAAATDAHQCELGRWYYSEGLAKYQSYPSMVALEVPHNQLHSTIKRIVDLNSQGKRVEAEKLLADVDRYSDEVVKLLSRLEDEIN